MRAKEKNQQLYKTYTNGKPSFHILIGVMILGSLSQ